LRLTDGRIAMVDFITLYRTHRRDVYRFALFLCGDATLAEDIVAETFLRVWSGDGRLDLPTVKAYLFAIARNLYLHEVRRPARRLAPLSETATTTEPSAERLAIASCDLAIVLAELQHLPEVDRAALVMRVEDQLPYKDIALILRLSVTAVKVKVHRARLRLAEARAQSVEKPIHEAKS